MKFYGMSWKSIGLSALMGIGLNLLAKNAAYNTANFDREAENKKLATATNVKESTPEKGK